jgi:hypothetical protein
MLSRWEDNVLEREDGKSENRRDDFPLSPELLWLLPEKSDAVRRLESVLCLGATMASSGKILAQWGSHNHPTVLSGSSWFRASQSSPFPARTSNI